MTEPTQPLTEGTGKTDTPGVLAVETVAIGPECFATKTGDVLCWRGRNYVPQDLHSADVRKFSGIVDELDAEVSRLRAENTALAERIAEVRELRRTWFQNADVVRGKADSIPGLTEVERAELRQGAVELEHCARQVGFALGPTPEEEPDFMIKDLGRRLGVGDNEKGETDGEA